MLDLFAVPGASNDKLPPAPAPERSATSMQEMHLGLVFYAQLMILHQLELQRSSSVLSSADVPALPPSFFVLPLMPQHYDPSAFGELVPNDTYVPRLPIDDRAAAEDYMQQGVGATSNGDVQNTLKCTSTGARQSGGASTRYSSEPSTGLPAPTQTLQSGNVMAMDFSTSSSPLLTSERQCCTHCSSTDTPEWRKGQDGLRTLCNACGLRLSRAARRAQSDGTTASKRTSKKRSHHYDRSLGGLDITANRTSAWVTAQVEHKDGLEQAHWHGELQPSLNGYAGPYLSDGGDQMLVDSDKASPQPPSKGSERDDDHIPSSLQPPLAARRRFPCPFAECDKTYSTSGHAARHSRVHEWLPPFACPHEGCTQTFTRRDNCSQHQRRTHAFQLATHCNLWSARRP